MVLYAVENSNPNPHDRTPPSRSEKAALHEHSYVDVKLYEHFRAKFEQRWASLPQTQQGYGLAKLRKHNHLAAGIGPDRCLEHRLLLAGGSPLHLDRLVIAPHVCAGRGR